MNIAVKLPNNLEEIIYTFPFLHQLYEIHSEENVNIHLITACDNIAVLNLLPFKAFYYDLDQKDSESVIKVLRAYKNSKLNLQRYDFYISLTNLKSDVLLGKILRAKKLVAFDDVGFDFLVSEKIHRLKGRKTVEQYFKLLSVFDKNINENIIKNIASKEFKVDLEKELESYILIDANILVGDDWLDFFEMFELNKILILGDVPLAYNMYTSIENRNDIELAKLIYLSKGYITNSYEKSLISSYVGVPCFYLKEEERVETSFEFYIGKVYDINPSNEDIGVVFDMIYEKLSKDVKEVRKSK